MWYPMYTVFEAFSALTESDTEITLENPAGDFICATTVNLQSMYIVMTLDIFGNLLIYGWNDHAVSSCIKTLFVWSTFKTSCSYDYFFFFFSKIKC